MTFKATNMIQCVLTAIALLSVSDCSLLKTPSVSLELLESGDADTLMQVRESLADLGMVALVSAEMSDGKNLLRDAMNCMELLDPSQSIEGVLRTTFPDDTERVLIATEDGESFDALPASCDTFRKHHAEYHAQIDDLVHRFIGSALNQLTAGRKFVNKQGQKFKDLSRVVEASSTKEHFSLYTNNALYKNNNTMDFHVDMGLMGVFTPVTFFDAQSAVPSTTTGFFVRGENGETVQVDLSGNSVLITMGAVAPAMLGSPEFPVKACEHGVKFPAEMKGMSRMWGGRMILPADDIVTSDGVTFADVLEASRRLFVHEPCNETKTENGKTFATCWMICQNVTACTASEVPECQLNGAAIDPLKQSMMAKLSCVPSSSFNISPSLAVLAFALMFFTQ